jgi:NAD-dependent DNA ligase
MIAGPTETALSLAFIVLMIVLAVVDERLADRRDDRDDVDEAHAAYVAGEIDERELEQRLEIAVDPEADRIRAAVEDVSGVGPARSAAIAREFETIGAVRDAGVDELADVPDVGRALAEAIDDRV